MIPQAFITAWRSVAPWADDAQVEQDLVISRSLVEIFSHPELATAMAFRGGTAIHKLFLAPSSRYSEDIDLVQVSPGPIGPLIGALRSRLDPWLGRPNRDTNDRGVTLTYRFDSEIPPTVRLRLKLEINTREHFAVLGFQTRHYAVTNGWFSGAAEIQTYALEELLGTKLRALHQRKKGRDLFDLSRALELAAVDPQKVVNCFLQYLERDGLTVSRAQFEATLTPKLADPAFATDIRSLATTGDVYDPRAAGRQVQETLVVRLPGEPWKRTPR